jgi:hypothetical protein
MKSRFVITVGSIGICLLMCGAVFMRQNEINTLRSQQELQLAQATNAASAVAQAQDPMPSGPSPEMSELLQLRNQVNQLTQQKRALAGVQKENETLRAKVVERGTNSAVGGLPPGYIRRRDAQWLGMGSPENTLQSFLWAVQNRNADNLLRVFSPESQQSILGQSGWPDKAFDEMSVMPGLRVVDQEAQPDGSVKVRVEIAPGETNSIQKIRFHQIDGEWRMDMR